MNQQRYNVRSQIILAQRGAALMVMLVILIVGSLAFLVTSLSKATLSLERSNRNSELLGISKDALLGYAISVGSRPGDLPYQDRLATPSEPNNGNYDGAQDGCSPLQPAPTATGCLGRLPWQTLKINITSPSENDPIGYMPWYAVSANMVDPAGVTFNSELLNSAPHTWLTVRDMNGNVLSNRVAFIVIIPGSPLPGQSRPGSPSLGGPNQYLDSITVAAGCTAPCVAGTYSNADADDSFIMGEEHRWINDPANPGKQIEDPGYLFNDRLLYVTIDELMPLIEKRVAREVKNCLDAYASTPVGTPSNKYPSAAPISPLGYTSATGNLFGRIPDVPTINTTSPLSPGNTSDPSMINLFNALSALQTAVSQCLSVSNAANQTALAAAGSALESATQTLVNAQPTTPAIPSAVTTPAITAGQRAQSSTRCSRINSGTSTSVQSNLALANSALGGVTISTPEDPSMQMTWPAGCFVAGTYWDDWKSLVLYQIADGYKPNASVTTPTCIPGSTCLTINGSGSYRAVIVLSGQKLPSQTRLAQTVDQYLDQNNNLNKSPTASNLNFNTFKPADANYSSVNDLALCLDGRNNCK